MPDESTQKYSQANADDQSFRLVCESVAEKFGGVMESMPDGIIIIDTSGRIVLANSQAEALFGYERGDLMSLMIETLVPTCHREQHVNHRNSYSADPHRRPMGKVAKLFGLRQDGAEFPVEISLSPMQFDDHGLLICAAVRDVTEKIRLTSIYRDSPIGLCCFDTELRYIDVNKWLAALNGISIEEHLGRTVKEVLPDVASEVESQLRQVLETGEPILDGEVVAETPAYPNIKKHFLHNYYPLKSNEGAIVGVSCAIQDVTLRKKAVEALENSRDVLEDRVRQRTKELEESNQHVRLILDSTAEAIYGLDLEGNCTFCNRACVDLLGYNRSEELLGQKMHDLIHHTRLDGSEYPLHECKIYEALRNGKETHLDDEVLWKADGSSFFAEYRSFPVSRDGELVGSVVTFLDITERKRIAETLRTQQSNLAHASRLSTLGEMAAGLAHELNQPLTAVSAFA